MSRVGVYSHSRGYLFLSYAKTTEGLYLAPEPPLVLEKGTDTEELGRILLELLQRPTATIPHPVDWKGFGSDLWKAVGEKRWNAFARNARYCSAELSAGYIELLPHKYEEQGSYFVADETSRNRITNSNRRNVGEALVQSFGATS